MAETYYVDFGSGSDSKSGKKPEEAWKHAPGDPNAEGKPASVTLGSGDVVQFRGGVAYRGAIVVPAGGEESAPVVYKGTGWGDGRAILDGSTPLTGWKKCASAADAGGNPNFANLFYVDVALETPFVNLQEQSTEAAESEFLYVAQDPNPEDPFFYDRIGSMHKITREQLTTTSITDSELFSGGDAKKFEGAALLVWGAPNFTRRVDILSYDPSTNTVTFEDTGASSLYPDGRDQYCALYNSPLAIDRAGEYSVGPATASGTRRIVLWPLGNALPEGRIFLSSIQQPAFDFNRQSYVTIEGFVVQKYVGGVGIQCGKLGDREGARGIAVRDCVVRKNSAASDRGLGGIYLGRVTDSIVENNEVHWNRNMRAIFMTNGEGLMVRNNTVSRAGSTAVVMYTCKNSQVIGNRLDRIQATHANAFTFYIGCENILVAKNLVTNSDRGITFQNSAPLYFFNNVVSGGYGVTEWPLKKNQPDPKGVVVFANNTFVNAEIGLHVASDAEKEFVVINNILSGLGSGNSKTRGSDTLKVTHNHNIFTKLAHFQQDRYGWKFGEDETTIDDMNALFVNPDKGDFRLRPGGPAIGAGADVSQYYPKEAFPNVNFDELANVTKPMNIGAAGVPPNEAK